MSSSSTMPKPRPCAPSSAAISTCNPLTSLSSIRRDVTADESDVFGSRVGGRNSDLIRHRRTRNSTVLITDKRRPLRVEPGD
jgi:hypothetical protein